MKLRTQLHRVCLSLSIPALCFGCANAKKLVVAPSPLEKYTTLATSMADVPADPRTSTFEGALKIEEVASQQLIDLVNFDDQAADQQVNDLTSTGGPAEDLTLAMLEEIALNNNPSIQQLSASASKAVAIRDQVGIKPNPTVGYAASQLADQGTDQHVFFMEQEFVRGNKLALNWSVMNQAAHAQLWEVEAQRMRVLTDIRTRFNEVVAAQRKLEATEKFVEIAEQGVEVAKRRQSAGETSQVEVLQAQIQFNEIELAIQQIKANYNGSWKELVAMAGVPSMQPRRVSEEFEQTHDHYEWEETYSSLLGSSPELAAARTRVAEAQALLCRQEAQPISNIVVQLGAGYDNSTNNGMLNLQFGAPIPVFNDNAGNISAAHAEYLRAAHDVKRVELSLKSRLAKVASEYEASHAAVDKFHNKILPDAEEMLSLSEQAYSAGELDFLQVLIIRKTFYDSKIRFIQAENDLAQAEAKIKGLLLTGGLNVMNEFDGDASLREQSFSGQ
ncbi:TolC family protein [Planctomicrobium sp.]|jgi:outer membrane protein, heavy metal efflux system|nr:TolC family protein [Planctomicrobium sp.]MBT5019038.1 TolC family protein [Planctomicrobium sp.]MDA7528111.1 TolC family protein [bacterium]MDB4743368.1 TolC family protein [Planctomicrobium sp.]